MTMWTAWVDLFSDFRAPKSDQRTSQIAIHPPIQVTQRELLFVCSHARFSSAGPVFTGNGSSKSTEHCLRSRTLPLERSPVFVSGSTIRKADQLYW
jgi:hypothetical protein